MTDRCWAALLAGFVLFLSAAAAAADRGVVSYSQGNCFIIRTNQGDTLFERSGGGQPPVKQKVSGVLHDFGYQTLYDGAGKKELMVGFVQNYGVKKADELESFKKNCR